MAQTIKTQIKKSKADAFRKLFIKRRAADTGLFESDWQEITEDVVRWGASRREVDPTKPGRFRLPNLSIKLSNDAGRYNIETNDVSLWNGFANQQRSLVKIEAGYTHETLGSDGIYTQTDFPSVPSAFIGLIGGDINQNSKNQINFRIKPLLSVFEDFPARLLTGWTSTGMSASEFMFMLRDQTDGAGGFVFRPFFDSTITSWEVTSTTTNYPGLNTNTGAEIIDATCWELMQDLALAENFAVYVTREGKLRFETRSPATSTATWTFSGLNDFDTEFGHTILDINKFGRRLENYYSRVQYKFGTGDTETAYAVTESTLTVSGTNNVWNFGHRTLSLENVWVSTTAPAQTVTDALHAEFSSPKFEIDFTTSLVPHLEVMDKVLINYDSTEQNPESLWDFNAWADDPAGDDLYWDDAGGDAIVLDNAEYRVLRIELNLDTMKSRFYCREI